MLYITLLAADAQANHVSGLFYSQIKHFALSVLIPGQIHCIIRSVHMIPAFAYGKSGELGKLIAQRRDDDGEYWLYYYVGM